MLIPPLILTQIPKCMLISESNCVIYKKPHFLSFLNERKEMLGGIATPRLLVILVIVLIISSYTSGAPRAKPVAPYFTPQWGDIPAKRWRIHPRPKAVAFCCRGKVPQINKGLGK
jgi:hypothetical protein